MTTDPIAFFATAGNSNSLPERVLNALRYLLEAWQFSTGFEIDPWQFSLRIQSLKELGVSENDCRWLFHVSAVVHGIEKTARNDKKRRFEQCDHSAFSKRSAFVLTEQGVQLARRSCALSYSMEAEVTRISPVWDDDTQELTLDGHIVKKFKLPAPNQATILTAFQEEQWAAKIDDPLSPTPGGSPKRRLHDTINALNRRQQKKLIRFYGDGTGTGVCWKLEH